MPGPSGKQQVGDDAEVLDAQLDQHRRLTGPARPNLAFRTWWKSRARDVASRSGSAAARHVTPVAGGELAELATVER